MSELQRSQITDLYNKGLTGYKIAKELNIAESWVYKVLRDLKDDGLIQEREIDYSPTYDYPIDCTKKVSVTCVYGCAPATTLCDYTAGCNYLLCTGHSRGCSPRACTKYCRTDANHPRLMEKKSFYAAKKGNMLV